MISYYLVKGDNNLFYIRKGIFGLFPFHFEFLNNQGDVYFHSKCFSRHGYFKTEEEALKCWEDFKKRPENQKIRFTVLRKLS